MNNGPPNDLLDLKSWLLRDLDDADATVRCIAVQELAEPGLPAPIVARLKSLADADPDPACRRHATEALAAQSRDRTAREGAHPLGPLTLDVLETSFASPDPTVKVRALTLGRSEPEPSAIEFVRRRLNDDIDPFLVAAELRFLARCGDADDAVLALPFLANVPAVIVLAALDVLGSQAPSLLLERLPELLAATDMRVRARALRWLSNIDRDSAREHLSVLINAPDLASRHVALKELLLSPFNVARPLLLQLLGRETQPTLLVMISLAIATNPDPDLPAAVFAIALLAHGLKQQILQDLLNQLVKSIQNSGILTVPIDEYLSRLKSELAQRKTVLQIHMALSRLASDDRETRLAALRWLGDHPNHPEVRVACETLAAQVESDPDIAAFVAQMRPVPTTPAAGAETRRPAASIDTPPDELQVERFTALTPAEQRKVLQRYREPAVYAKNRHAILQLMQARIDGRTLVEMIALMGRCGGPDDAAALSAWLDADDPSVTAETVRALGRLDPARLDPNLQTLVNHADSLIRTAALEVYLERDKEQALQHIGVMLLATQRQERLLGLSLLPRLDFATAEPLLLDFVRREKDRELLALSSYLLAANLSLDGMLAVYQAIHDDQGHARREVGSIWDDALNTTELAQPGANFAARVAERHEAVKAAREKAIKSRPRNAPPPPPRAGTDDEADERKRWMLLIGGVVLMLLLTVTIHHFFAGRDDSGSSTSTTGTPDDRPAPFRLPTGKLEIEGAISFVDPGGNGILITNKADNTRYFVTLKSTQENRYNKGDSWKGSVRATGHQRGTIIAELW